MDADTRGLAAALSSLGMRMLSSATVRRAGMGLCPPKELDT
jgi:hypothetical protein